LPLPIKGTNRGGINLGEHGENAVAVCEMARPWLKKHIILGGADHGRSINDFKRNP
jgi:hypothetical protein